MNTLNLIGWSILLVSWISMYFQSKAYQNADTAEKSEKARTWSLINLVLSGLALGVFISAFFV